MHASMTWTGGRRVGISAYLSLEDVTLLEDLLDDLLFLVCSELVLKLAV